MTNKTDRILSLASSFVDEKLGRRADVLYYHPTARYGILRTDMFAGTVTAKVEYIYTTYAVAFDLARDYVLEGGTN